MTPYTLILDVDLTPSPSSPKMIQREIRGFFRQLAKGAISRSRAVFVLPSFEKRHGVSVPETKQEVRDLIKILSGSDEPSLTELFFFSFFS